MCFTVSTLLSDGETVVGMDLDFSEAQESILRMTQGYERTAMIVTSGGQCEDKGLQFVCSRIEPLDETYVGDDLKLKQVLINILGNAVKFTDAPGVITFTVEQTEAAEERAVLRFKMEDTGIC